MTAFDGLQDASFDGIAFPVERVSVRGGLRKKTHEYPHTPGGALEKLGRKNYMITIVGNFQTTFQKYGDELWPRRLDDLRTRFEQETTADLHIPTIGTIKACCVNWSQEMTNRILSGEKAEFEFEEDQGTAFLTEALISITQQSLKALGGDLIVEVEALGFGDFFDTLNDLIGSITGLADQVELYGDMFSSKIGGVLAEFDRLDKTFGGLNEPANSALLESFLNAWEASARLQQDALKQQTPLIQYVVPMTMAVNDVSRALYGSNENAVKILQLNPIEDAFAIPKGTRLVVYAPKAA